MSKGAKIALFTAIGLLVVGGITIGIVAATVGFDGGSDSSDDDDDETTTDVDDVKADDDQSDDANQAEDEN